MYIHILCVGDVVGRAGRSVLAEHLPKLIQEHSIDFVVCNAENAAGGSGLTPQIFEKLQRYGVDVVTLGDHCFRKSEIFPQLDSSNRIIRPINLPPTAVGKGWTVVPSKSGRYQIGVVCAMGQMEMGNSNSPWTAMDEVLSRMPSEAKIRILDFHAEATSEKIAMGWHLDGRVSLLFGTHTHVATADESILPKGTGYITDLGMTGPYDSVLGRRKDRVLRTMITSVPSPYDVAEGDPRMYGVLAEINPQTGRTVHIERVRVDGPPVPEGHESEP